MEQRAILHLDLDSFFVSVERLKNPLLIGKPVIVGGNANRGVVSSCSYEAKKMGVKAAMPMVQAMRLCPEAIIAGGPGSMKSYGEFSKMVTQIIAEKSPLFEKSSIDEFYIDLSGMDKYFGTYKWALALKQTIISQTGLPISIALASNKLVSKIATNEAKPNGQIQVAYRTEKQYLAPLSVAKIPGVGKKMQNTLSQMGIHIIETLQNTSKAYLEAKLGNYGHSLWEKAHGIDSSPVEPYHEQKSISKEHTYENDVSDTTFLIKTILVMTEKLGFELRKLGKKTTCVGIKVRFSNFETHTFQKSIPLTSDDHILIATSKELFNQYYDKSTPIRLIGVKFSNLKENADFQLNIFENSEENNKLNKATDFIKSKFGEKAVRRAGGIE